MGIFKTDNRVHPIERKRKEKTHDLHMEPSHDPLRWLAQHPHGRARRDDRELRPPSHRTYGVGFLPSYRRRRGGHLRQPDTLPCRCRHGCGRSSLHHRRIHPAPPGPQPRIDGRRTAGMLPGPQQDPERRPCPPLRKKRHTGRRNQKKILLHHYRRRLPQRLGLRHAGHLHHHRSHRPGIAPYRRGDHRP